MNLEPRKPGNKNLPDFNELSDRVIAESPSQPILVIKTNLDPKDAKENNPYSKKGDVQNPEEFKNYFEE